MIIIVVSFIVCLISLFVFWTSKKGEEHDYKVSFFGVIFTWFLLVVFSLFLEQNKSSDLDLLYENQIDRFCFTEYWAINIVKMQDDSLIVDDNIYTWETLAYNMTDHEYIKVYDCMSKKRFLNYLLWNNKI